MRIEEADKTKLSKAYDKELLILKLRFTQLFDKNFKDNDNTIVGSLNRNSFMKKYKLLLDEMNSRKLEHSTSAIDKAAFSKAMTASKYGIDVSDCDDIVLVENFAYVTSAIKTEKDGRLATIINVAKSELIDIIKKRDEPSEAYIPLYDLVLKAKSNTEIIEVSKPYPNEHAARLQEPDKFDIKSFRRTNGGTIYGSKKIPSSIGIIWGKLEGKTKPSDPPIPQSLRFPKADWTVTKAKKWLTDNDIKHITFEPAKKITKKLLPKTGESEVSKEVEKFISVYQFDKADKDEQIVCGIVYEPDEVDAQGDFANEVEIKKAAYKFMENVQKFKVMHKGNKVKVKVLESYIAPSDFTIMSKSVKKGSWLITVRVLDKEIWKAVQDGELTGFSMAGYARTE